MTIYEISQKFDVSLRTLKKLQKAGVLLADICSDKIEHILDNLKRGNALSVSQLISLIEDKTLINSLSDTYKAKVNSQIMDLGDYRKDSAQIEVYAYLSECAQGDKEAAKIIVKWIKSILPFDDVVVHSWLAVRAVINIPEPSRQSAIAKIPWAFTNIRKLPEFTNCFKLVGKKTYYSNFDKLDL